jgi:AraC family transcriptional regulator
MRDCGKLAFTVTGHGLAVYPPGATFGPRTLRDFEFVWIIEGDCVWECDGGRHPVPAGTVLLARPGMRDGFIWDPRRHTRHGYIHFLLERRGADLPPETQWPLVRALSGDDIIRPLFRHLAWLLSVRGPDWEELAQGALRQVLMAFISGANGVAGEEGVERSPIVDAVMETVQRAWAGGVLAPLTLDDLARAAGVTRGHLSRVFAQSLGVTPMETLRLLRLDRAATLLARSNLAIQAIAAQTGFGNPFHFSRVFRATYGHSPREFRRHIANGMNLPTIRLVQVRGLSTRMWQSR